VRTRHGAVAAKKQLGPQRMERRDRQCNCVPQAYGRMGPGKNEARITGASLRRQGTKVGEGRTKGRVERKEKKESCGQRKGSTKRKLNDAEHFKNQRGGNKKKKKDRYPR